MALGLTMNLGRAETRQAYRTLRAIRDAFSGPVPLEYFRAQFDSDVEADAMHALHVSRCESENEKQNEPPI